MSPTRRDGPDRDATRLSRRGLLAGLGALGLAACTPPEPAPPPGPVVTALLAGALTIDMHSHAGHNWRGATAEDVAGAMRAGGLSAVCLATTADGPLNRVVGDRIVSTREPRPGELHRYTLAGFAHYRALAAAQGMTLVRTAADLDATRGGAPGAIIAAEGADFLDGDPERLDAAHREHALRHLQLTHYRVNELGDIQTEAPRDGLTAFGADVIRRCNRLGIVVDVAHGTHQLVKQAAAVTTRPLVLSHTSLVEAPAARSRRIAADHARAIAATGGVIGVWPVRAFFPDLRRYAEGMARLADIVGAEHVGLGSDLRGLPGGACFDDYRQLPALAAALLAAGFDAAGAAQVLGGNYRRVFAATVGTGGA